MTACFFGFIHVFHVREQPRMLLSLEKVLLLLNATKFIMYWGGYAIIIALSRAKVCINFIRI